MFFKFKPYFIKFIKIKGSGTLDVLTGFIIAEKNNNKFKFTEIGVFKGDNAFDTIKKIRKLDVDIFYVGFDIFEEQERFYASYPSERAVYDTKEWPYWEFQSGQHAFGNVKKKISLLLDQNKFSLIRGDSNNTVKSHINEIVDSDIVYIDGCHDYEIVSKDWENISSIMDINPRLVIVFDDSNLKGVAKLRSEIEKNKLYLALRLNDNQFFVISNKLRWYKKAIFIILEWWFR